MAKQKTEKTTAAKHLERLKNDLKAAKKKLTAQDNAANKSAVKKIQDEMSPVLETVNRERFIRVAGPRFNKAVKAIEQLQSCANPRAYEFTEVDASLACDKLTEAVKTLRTKFTSALSGGTGKAAKAKAGNIFAETEKKE